MARQYFFFLTNGNKTLQSKNQLLEINSTNVIYFWDKISFIKDVQSLNWDLILIVFNSPSRFTIANVDSYRNFYSFYSNNKIQC